MQMDLRSISSTFALSQVESEVFEHLLEYGEIKAVELRKILHLDRTPFYRTLTLLESKNLIVISGSLRKQLVALQNIDSIEESLEVKKVQIESASKSLSSLKANMKELRDGRYHKDNLEIFSGDDAYLQSMQTVLAGGGKLLRDITPDSEELYKMSGGKEKYSSIVQTIKSQRLKKNIKIQILFDNQAKNIDEHSKTDQLSLKESRVFAGNLKLDCYLNTCGTRSLFYTKDANGSWGIVIKDPLITNLLNSLFDVIWNLSKPL